MAKQIAIPEIKKRSSSLFEGDTYGRVLTLIIVVVILFIFWQVYKLVKNGLNKAGNAIQNENLSSQAPQGQSLNATQIAQIRLQAKTLWNEGVTNYLFYDFDEDMFISIINSQPNGYAVELLSRFYQDESGRSLRADVDSCLNSSEIQRISKYYSNLI